MAKDAPELWVWMMTDPDTDEWAVAYIETAGGAKVPMVATDEKSARRMLPIVQKMVEMMHVEWRLFHTGRAELVETVTPE